MSRLKAVSNFKLKNICLCNKLEADLKPDSVTLTALKGFVMEVMVGIPNEMLYSLANSVSAWIQYFVPSIQASHISRTRDVVIQYILQYSKQKDCKPGTRGNYSTYYNKHLSIRFHLGTLEPDSSSYAYTLCEPHCDSKLDIEKVRVHLNSFESIIN